MTPVTSATKMPASSVGAVAPVGQRPAQVVSHESGARVEVPAGPVLISPKVELTALETPAELQKLELFSPVLQFDQYSSVGFEQKVSVDLPSGNGGDKATVFIWSHLGCWIPLPSQAITLPDGRPGRRVLIDREPTPWRLVVARRPAAMAIPPDAPGSNLFRLEALRWTDKDALLAEMVKEAARSRGKPASVVLSLASVAYAAPLEATQSQQMAALATEAQLAFLQLNLAYNKPAETQRALDAALLAAPLSQRKSVLEYGFEQWEKGLRALRQLRSLSGRDEFELEGDILSVLSDAPTSMPLNQFIEELTAKHAPWGLDLTLALIDKGVITKKFYLGVLEPLGYQDFVDVDLSPEPVRAAGMPWPAGMSEALQAAKLDPTASDQRLFMRFFSTRTMKKDWIETILEGGDLALRWAPVVYGFATGGPVGSALAWAVAEHGIEYLEETYDADAVTYVRVEYGTVLGNEGVETSFALLKDRGLFGGGSVLQPGELRASASQLLLSAALKYSMEKMDLGYLKEVRRITAGLPAYCERSCGSWGRYDVPPVLLVAAAMGPQFGLPPEEYPRSADVFTTWYLDYKQVYPGEPFESYGLHGFISGTESELAGSPIRDAMLPQGLPWKRYREDRTPVITRAYDSSPNEQWMKLAIPRDAIRAELARLGKTDDWKTVDLAKLGIALSLEVAGQRFSPTWEDAGVAGNPPDARVIACRVAKEGVTPIDRSKVDAGFQSEVTTLPKLYARYHVSVVNDQAREIAGADASFLPGGNRQSGVDTSDPGQWKSYEKLDLAAGKTETGVDLSKSVAIGIGVAGKMRFEKGTVSGRNGDTESAVMGVDNIAFPDHPIKWNGTEFEIPQFTGATASAPEIPVTMSIKGKVSDSRDMLEYLTVTYQEGQLRPSSECPKEVDPFSGEVLCAAIPTRTLEPSEGAVDISFTITNVKLMRAGKGSGRLA